MARKMHHFDGNASPDFASAHPGYDAVVKFIDMLRAPSMSATTMHDVKRPHRSCYRTKHRVIGFRKRSIGATCRGGFENRPYGHRDGSVSGHPGKAAPRLRERKPGYDQPMPQSLHRPSRAIFMRSAAAA
jgi:hypothetical protein